MRIIWSIEVSLYLHTSSLRRFFGNIATFSSQRYEDFPKPKHPVKIFWQYCHFFFATLYFDVDIDVIFQIIHDDLNPLLDAIKLQQIPTLLPFVKIMQDVWRCEGKSVSLWRDFM